MSAHSAQLAFSILIQLRIPDPGKVPLTVSIPNSMNIINLLDKAEAHLSGHSRSCPVDSPH